MSHAASQSRRSAGETPARATGRCEARDTVLTERRGRYVHPAPILQYSGDAMRLGRPCVVGAVQIAPTRRIRPREVPRDGGSEAYGASKSRPSNLKLAVVAYWYEPAVCAQRSRQIRHIRMVNARADARAASSGPFATADEPGSFGILCATHTGCICAAAAAA